MRAVLFRRLTRPGSGLALAELFALCGFAFVQPVLGVLGDTPEFFLYRRASPADILAFVALVVAGPPLALWAVEFFGGLLWPHASGRLHAGLLAALAVLVICSVVRAATPLRGLPFLVAVALSGGLFGALIRRFRVASRLWLRYAAAAPIAFVILFLIVSPSGDLVRQGGEAEEGRA